MPKGVTTKADAQYQVQRLLDQIAVEKLTSKNSSKLKKLRKELETAKVVLAAITKND